MMTFASFALTVAAALMAVNAAHIPRTELSACSTAIQSVLSSSDAALSCVAPGALLDFALLSIKNANFSLTDASNAADNWLTQFCAVGSQDTLNSIASNLTAGCGDLGINNATNFGLIRDTMCLKDTVTDKFCTVEAFSVNGTESQAAEPSEMLLGLLLSASPLAAKCNECTKAQYQLAVKAGDSNFQPLQDICGANFTATLNSTVVGVTSIAVAGDFALPKGHSVAPHNGAGLLAPPAGLLLAVLGLSAL
ncbi:hypothetical protein DFH06DRAFT_1374287 [Mycena polygramma]|nr:hypothetical protein DFH06DRAFT_1374287 [Mycena polygramma]